MRTRSLLCRRTFVGVGVTSRWRTNANVLAYGGVNGFSEMQHGGDAIVGSSQESRYLTDDLSDKNLSWVAHKNRGTQQRKHTTFVVWGGEALPCGHLE